MSRKVTLLCPFFIFSSLSDDRKKGKIREGKVAVYMVRWRLDAEGSRVVHRSLKVLYARGLHSSSKKNDLSFLFFLIKRKPNTLNMKRSAGKKEEEKKKMLDFCSKTTKKKKNVISPTS